MSIYNINREELLQILSQLDQGLYNHLHGYKMLNRSLICQIPCDKQNLSPEAHKKCLFG